jgi:hypothetical protein
VILADLRKGLAAAARDAVGAHQVTCLAYVPKVIDPPCLFVTPERVEYDKTMARGVDEARLFLTLLVSTVEDEDAQEFLDSFVDGSGPASIKQVIDAARGAPGQAALGGACDDVHLSSCDAYQWFTVGDVQYLGARWSLRCIGSGGS